MDASNVVAVTTRIVTPPIEGHPLDEPLEEAWTAPSSWYTDPRVTDVERDMVFARTWQLVAREDQLANPGDYVTAEIAREPIVVVRGKDGVLRAFFNVCRHHAAAVMTEPCGNAQRLRCPYHGWTYGLDGALQSVSEFRGARRFELADNGLVGVEVSAWQGHVFVRIERPREGASASFEEEIAPVLAHVAKMGGEAASLLTQPDLVFHERRAWDFDCNWKVFVDNYLDGGYHIPFLHRELNQFISFDQYAIDNFDRSCLQSSPVEASATGQLRRGHALYLWVYPNLMFNAYEGWLDTNYVLPIDQEKTRVVFDFWCKRGAQGEDHQASIELAYRIQNEDVAICASVQRGLRSRAYDRGRLSPRREAGEHLFHRLLAKDLLGR